MNIVKIDLQGDGGVGKSVAVVMLDQFNQRNGEGICTETEKMYSRKQQAGNFVEPKFIEKGKQ